MKQLRLDKGVTQSDIANVIGVSSATIGNYEQGTRKPRKSETWEKIADYFGVSIDYLIDEDWNVLNDNILTLRKVFIKMIEFNDKNTLYDSKYLSCKLERKLLKAFLTKNKNIFNYIFNICISKKSLINTIIKKKSII